MSITSVIEKFNTHSMSEESVLTLVTGRDKLIENISSVIDENINKPNTTQHLALIGPRGMGKSFLLRYFQIITRKNNTPEIHIDYSLLPEEQHNINAPSEFIDELIARIENSQIQSKPALWDSKNENWEKSVNQLKAVIEKSKEKYSNYLFIAAVENIDILLETVFKSKADESKFRKLLTAIPNFMLIATSLKSDIDTDYNKRLFNAFQKLHVEAWTEEDYLNYFSKRFELLKQQNPETYSQKDIGLLTNKLKAIAQFTGGSPRMAVVLTNLIFNDDAISTAKTLNDIVEDLSPYYQDLMSKMPPKSKILFDALVQAKENISQSDLATNVGTKQATISQAFKWLLENNYINGHKVSGEKQYRYSVADRIFVLFYFKRYVYCGLECSYVRVLSDFLVSFYNTKELGRNTIKYLHNGSKPEGVELARMVFQKVGHNHNKINWDNHEEIENEISKIVSGEEIKDLLSEGENKLLEKNYQEALRIHQEALEISLEGNDILNQFLCLGKIVNVYINLEDFNKVIENSQKVYELSLKEGLVLLQIRYLSIIGIAYSFLKDSGKALDFCQKAFSLCNQVEDIEELDAVFFAFGIVHNHLKNFEKAITYHQKALTLWEQQGDISEQAKSLGQIGLNYEELKDFKNAITYYQRALTLFKQEEDISEQAKCLGHIGRNYEGLKDFESAIVYHQKALTLWEQAGDISWQAWNLEQIGWNYKRLKDFEGAIAYHQKALTLREQAGDISWQAWNLGQIGVNYLLNGSEKGWELLDNESYSNIPKEQILKQFADCVVFKEEWEGKAPAFEIANTILTAIKTKNWVFDRNKAVSNFFARLLKKNLHFGLLKDICNEVKGMFGNEGDIIADAVLHCIIYVENGKDSNYLLKINPDMAIVVKAIIEEAEI